MNGFGSLRRDFLKMGGLGLAAALPGTARASGFGGAAEREAAGRRALATVFDVRTYGAKGDGRTVDTAAIRAAVNAASDAGGGTVYFPAGTWVSFSIPLKSNVEIYLAQGCRLLAADSPLPGETTGYQGGTYDAAEPKQPWESYQDYGHNHWHNSLIWGENLHDVSITGPGLIDGKGLSNGREWVKDPDPFLAEQPGVGNKAIALKRCRNVILRDFSILKGGHFGVLATGVDNLTIDNLKIDTDRDGIDIDCCRNVRVSNCTVNSPWDDAICPKSSFALGEARMTENVTITNCFVTGCYELGSVLDGTFRRFAPGAAWQTGRIKCGTESNGGFRNIAISNCVFEGCQGLALESEDGALLEDVTISNITMRDVVSAPLFLRLGARMRGPKGVPVGTLRRVLIDNLVSYNARGKVCSIVSGVPGYAIEDVRISNVFLEGQGGGTAEWAALRPAEEVTKYPDPDMFGPTPAQGFFLRHVKGLAMSHVEVKAIAPDARPAFYVEEAERVDFVAVTAPVGQPAFRFEKARDVRVAISRAAKDTVMETADGVSL